jgi:hypothetical protein
MDIDYSQYQKKLLEILRSIANASFVTFDLEMSGISTRPKAGDRTYDVGKATLQQQYDEIKSAAETFQTLQMGLTCVEEDREKGKFSATYLFHRLCLSIVNWVEHTRMEISTMRIYFQRYPSRLINRASGWTENCFR